MDTFQNAVINIRSRMQGLNMMSGSKKMSKQLFIGPQPNRGIRKEKSSYKFTQRLIWPQIRLIHKSIRLRNTSGQDPVFLWSPYPARCFANFSLTLRSLIFWAFLPSLGEWNVLISLHNVSW